jgi:phosphonate ABC transporter permease subunit PhnE
MLCVLHDLAMVDRFADAVLTLGSGRPPAGNGRLPTDMPGPSAIDKQWRKSPSGRTYALARPARSFPGGGLGVRRGVPLLAARAPRIGSRTGLPGQPAPVSEPVLSARFHRDRQAGAALLETGRMAVLATGFASLLALVIAPLAARTVAPGWVVWPTRLFLNLVRSIPSLVWALLAVAIVGANPRAGVIALTCYSLGYLGKFFSDAFEAWTRDRRRSACAGAHPVQAFQFGLWPEVKPLIWSHALWMLEYNVRAGTIIGYVGAGGIGTLLYTYQEFYQWDRFAAVLCFILVIVTVLDLAGARLRAALLGHDPVHRATRSTHSRSR